MWSRRAQEYEAKINSGDLISIAEVVRDLHRAEDQPRAVLLRAPALRSGAGPHGPRSRRHERIEEVKAQQHVDEVLGGRVAA